MSEQDFKKLSVEEVLEAVQNGKISAEEAIAIETQGKSRKTLLEALEGLKVDNGADEFTEEPNLISVKLIENIKLGKVLFKAGDKLGVDEALYEELLSAKVIETDQ